MHTEYGIIRPDHFMLAKLYRINYLKNEIDQ